MGDRGDKQEEDVQISDECHREESLINGWRKKDIGIVLGEYMISTNLIGKMEGYFKMKIKVKQ
jgi:hypothetical protein